MSAGKLIGNSWNMHVLILADPQSFSRWISHRLSPVLVLYDEIWDLDLIFDRWELRLWRCWDDVLYFTHGEKMDFISPVCSWIIGFPQKIRSNTNLCAHKSDHISKYSYSEKYLIHMNLYLIRRVKISEQFL